MYLLFFHSEIDSALVHICLVKKDFNKFQKQDQLKTILQGGYCKNEI